VRKACYALAQTGYKLYQQLFRPDASQVRIGKDVREWLDKLPKQDAIQTLEIVIEGARFVPWNVIYDRKLDEKAFLASGDSPDHWQPFWGLRYNLAGVQGDFKVIVTLRTEYYGRLVDRLRRVCIKGFLEGLSAQAVRTVETEPKQAITLKLLPTLLPERARAITEIQRATLHILVEDLDGKPESHDTYSIVCLARTSSFNAVRRPDTGQMAVTPHAKPVQERIRRAADLWPGGRISAYQGDPDSVPQQVAALYQSLQEAGLVYINSVIDYGAPAGQATQRTCLPRESLALKSANCIDGSVLMASLLEGASPNPALNMVSVRSGMKRL
jgi:hypothetical protein